MSKIVITADQIKDRPRFISHVRRVTGKADADIEPLLDGHAPLGEWVLSSDDHDEVAAQLRDMMEIEERGKGTLRIFELGPHEDFSKVSADECEISADVLRNILNSHDQHRPQSDSDE